MKIDCIADLHGYFPELEGGDLLIIAGDLTARDLEDEYYDFNIWLCKQEYQKKIVIAGNHDGLLHKDSFQYLEGYPAFEYLQDSGCEYNGLQIWGSPWSPLFHGVNPHCTAFMQSDEALHNKWQMIPEDIDILITHSPAYGTLDGPELMDGSRYHMGSKSLANRLRYNGRPQVHVFGHIHEGYGQEEAYPSNNGGMMKSINCSYVNKNYEPVNKPIRIIL